MHVMKRSTGLSERVSSRIAERKNRLDAIRPLNAVQVRKLREQLQVEMTYNSNAIEGNSLTQKETFLVLQEGITFKNKPLRDHLEAKDHNDALDFLYELVDARRVTLSGSLIRQLHALIVRETDRDWAGRYRTGAVYIVGASHIPPDAIDVPGEVDELIRWFSQYYSQDHPIGLAALLHHRLAKIHPFTDGNGRTARLLMNLVLMRSGYPIAILLKNDRKKYYRALEQADHGETAALVLLVAQAVERSLDVYLRALEPSVDGGRLMTLTEASNHCAYSGKYLNLLIRQGQLAGVKRGRKWYTSIKDIEAYRGKRLRKR